MAPPVTLGIDTTTPQASVAAFAGLDRQGEIPLRTDEPHSRTLPGTLGAVLRLAGATEREVAIVAVATGPGGFTGVRVGLATAKGLAMALGCPVLGYSTLETLALAHAERLGGEERIVAVVQEAGRGEVYRGIYRCASLRAMPVAEEAVLPTDRAVEGIPGGAIVCGSAVAPDGGSLHARIPGHRIVEVRLSIGGLLARRGHAARDDDRAASRPLVPNYRRASDAERSARA